MWAPTNSTACRMLDLEVTSRVRQYVLGKEARSLILEMSRAVAKTVKPFRWKVRARAWPMPPALQPVMRTDGAILPFDDEKISK